MKMLIALSLYVSFGLGSFAQAQSNPTPPPAHATHTGKIEVTLKWVDHAGKADEIESKKLDLAVSWVSKKGHLKLAETSFAPCTLDVSRDLLNSRNELIMKGMPQLRFDANVVEAIIKIYAQKEKGLSASLDGILNETRSERKPQFDLPFYSCSNSECIAVGKAPALVNAFEKDGSVEREVSISHLRFAGRKLVLTMKIYDLKGYRASFNVIDNTADGNFER